MCSNYYKYTYVCTSICCNENSVYKSHIGALPLLYIYNTHVIQQNIIVA